MYKCPECDYTAEEPGTCPTHNVELIQEAAPEGETPSAEGEIQ